MISGLQLDYLQTPNSKGVPKKHTTTASFYSLLFSSLLYSSIVPLSLWFLSCFCPTDQKPPATAPPAESVRLSLALAAQAAAAATEIESEREDVRWKNGKEGKKQIYTQMQAEFDVGKEGRDIWPQAVMAVTFVPGSTRFQPLFPAQFWTGVFVSLFAKEGRLGLDLHFLFFSFSRFLSVGGGTDGYLLLLVPLWFLLVPLEICPIRMDGGGACCSWC